MTSEEKVGGLPLERRRVLAFHALIFYCRLMDMGFKEQRFTWEIRRENNIKERLDRAFTNTKWRVAFNIAQCINLPAVGSDHSPLFIALDTGEKKSERIFRFETPGQHQRDARKLLNSNGRVRKEIDSLMKDLTQIQDSSHSEGDKQTTEIIIAKLEAIWATEEMFWHQRSRVKLVKYGDQNTKFFHLNTIQRRSANKILRLKNSVGNWVDKEDDIERILLNHYAKLFRSNGARDWSEALDHVERVVTVEMNDELIREATNDEVKAAAFDMGA
ncbi:Endonuclease/exonuclease/phosphatase [Corchorus capsularis]|uniref:Endonuclease/exonuclease/phosphatase n=1 Tax=Corchorus capsularis TaxID=210143 RepID=A0A1R3G221_COCAP|nr:Endonuclease/exonuclease/phosphatase [Corchorus capsularis]